MTRNFSEEGECRPTITNQTIAKEGRMLIEERVLQALRKVFPEVQGDSNVDNLDNWDSLNHLRALLGLEEEFKVAFTPEEMGQMTSVKTMVAVISSKISEG